MSGEYFSDAGACCYGIQSEQTDIPCLAFSIRIMSPAHPAANALITPEGKYGHGFPDVLCSDCLYRCVAARRELDVMTFRRTEAEPLPDP